MCEFSTHGGRAYHLRREVASMYHIELFLSAWQVLAAGMCLGTVFTVATLGFAFTVAVARRASVGLTKPKEQ